MQYIAELSHKRRSELGEQMPALYELARENGTADFVAALELAAEQQMYGVEYVRVLLGLRSVSAPVSAAKTGAALLELPVPAQHEVERDLAQYEHYVANRARVLELASTPQTGAQA